MAIQQCERCGADLPPTAPGATVTCSYCGVEQRLSMLPQPAAPTRSGLPAIARVDPMRARTLFELFLREIQSQSGVDVRREGQAVERLVRAAAQAVLELDATGRTEVNLPFLTATAAGPIHYQRQLTRADLEARAFGAGNPFAPAASARYATREDIAAEIQARQAARGESSRTGCIVTTAILLFVGVAVGVGAIATSGGGNGAASPDVAAVVADVAPAVVPPKTPADADHDNAWVALPASRLSGDFHGVDGVAQLPWALGLAREWAPDATLESFYANGIRADGTCDVSDHDDSESSHEPNLDYRFVSAARRAQAAQRIQVAENDVRSSFRIWIHDGTIAVMSDVERGDDLEDKIATPLEPQPDCKLDHVLQLMRDHGLPIRPKYDLTTTWDADDGDWTWWIDMTDVGDANPRIDATTCRARR